MIYSTTKIGRFLKSLRSEVGLTIEEVAKFCNASPSYISMIENGQRLPSIRLLLKFAQLYNRSIFELVGLLTEEMKINSTPILEKDKEKSLEEMAKIRLAQLYPFLFPSYSEDSLEDMLIHLEKNFPERIDILYKKAIESCNDIKKEKIDKKEVIKKWLMRSPTLKERISLNMLPDLGVPILTYKEMITKIKQTFDWTWKRLGAEFGVNERTVQRWAKGETKIPEKVKRRLEFLYYVIYERIKNFTEPLKHLYPGNSPITPEIIFKELKKFGIDEEIKKRIVKKYPIMKKFLKKSIEEFFYEYAKRFSTIRNYLRIGTKYRLLPREKRCAGFTKIIANIDKRNKKNTQNNLKREGVKKKNNGKNKKSEEFSDDTGEGDDWWILKEKLKNRIIINKTNLLFENLKLKLQAEGKDGVLPRKEEPMNIIKRSDSPYYYIDISLNGLRIKKSTRCKNKKIAEKIASLVLYKLWNEQMYNLLSETPKFSEISKKFVEYQRKNGKKSWDREDLCHRKLLPFLGKLKIDQITPKKIQETLEKIAEQPGKGNKKLSPRSIDYLRGYLHRMFEYARDIEGVVKENPVEKVPPLKYDNKRTRILTIEEEWQLLNAVENELARDMINFLLFTGLRIGEALNLKKSDFLKVEDILYFKIKREKNNQWTEFPIVWDELKNIVDKYLKMHLQNEKFFCYPDGKDLKMWDIIKHLRKGIKKTGIKNLCFNDLRRTFYTRMTLAGCDFLILEYLMGHKSSHISSRYFSFTVKDVAEHLKKLKIKNVPHLSQFKDEEKRNDIV